jgi:hypothetical protein
MTNSAATFTTRQADGVLVHQHEAGSVAITARLALSHNSATNTWCFSAASDSMNVGGETGQEVAAAAIVQGF